MLQENIKNVIFIGVCLYHFEGKWDVCSSAGAVQRRRAL